jgi:hypothetical protein
MATFEREHRTLHAGFGRQRRIALCVQTLDAVLGDPRLSGNSGERKGAQHRRKRHAVGDGTAEQANRSGH